LARTLYDGALTALEGRLRELLAAGKDRDLFGRRRGLDTGQRSALRRLRRGRAELRRALRQLSRHGTVPFFSIESHFGDVLCRGGFDLVLGNPPWVRGERLSPRVRETLAHRYLTWKYAPAGAFAHAPDLSVAFCERALELVAPGGIVALLVPEKLATSGYAEALRRHLATTTRLERVAPLGEEVAGAFGAAVYPMALVVARRDPEPGTGPVPTLGPAEARAGQPQGSLQVPGPWVLVPDAAAIAGRLERECARLGERWVPRLGVKTGADALFLLAEPVAGSRPALRGRDVRRWTAAPRRYLIWTHDMAGRPLAHLPAALAARLDPHVERLRRRTDYRDGPVWQLFRVGLAIAPHRVVWADLARELTALVPPPEVVPLNTVYGVVARSADDAHALTALLNTRWCTALARLAADPARGGFRRFNAHVVARLPVPRTDERHWLALARYGRMHESADEFVADLYGLDARDRRILERLAPNPR
jgi:adenine-specific DNA-methyltransferase